MKENFVLQEDTCQNPSVSNTNIYIKDSSGNMQMASLFISGGELVGGELAGW